MRRLCSVASLALLAGCAIELDDLAGRACDDAHPCRAPRACIRSLCLDLSAPDGGTDAGSPDAALPVPDAGSDGGVPRWQQRLHGFTGSTVDTAGGCTLDIDPTRGNRVLATVVGPADNQDTALAELIDVNRLPRTLEGRFKGRITLPAPVGVRGFVPIAYLGTQTGQAFARLGFDNSGQLVVESDAQTLGTAALVERFQVDGGFNTGDWMVEVAYRVGTSREVRINDVLVASTAVSGGASTPPDELSLGIARYDGDAGGPFTLTLSSWQLADDLTVVLP